MAQHRKTPPTSRSTGKPGDPCVMVIFGVTGDLAKRKLFPALYNLARKDYCHSEFAIVGVARSPMSDRRISHENFRRHPGVRYR